MNQFYWLNPCPNFPTFSGANISTKKTWSTPKSCQVMVFCLQFSMVKSSEIPWFHQFHHHFWFKKKLCFSCPEGAPGGLRRVSLAWQLVQPPREPCPWTSWGWAWADHGKRWERCGEKCGKMGKHMETSWETSWKIYGTNLGHIRKGNGKGWYCKKTKFPGKKSKNLDNT